MDSAVAFKVARWSLSVGQGVCCAMCGQWCGVWCVLSVVQMCGQCCSIWIILWCGKGSCVVWCGQRSAVLAILVLSTISVPVSAWGGPNESVVPNQPTLPLLPTHKNSPLASTKKTKLHNSGKAYDTSIEMSLQKLIKLHPSKTEKYFCADLWPAVDCFKNGASASHCLLRGQH